MKPKLNRKQSLEKRKKNWSNMPLFDGGMKPRFLLFTLLLLSIQWLVPCSTWNWSPNTIDVDNTLLNMVCFWFLLSFFYYFLYIQLNWQTKFVFPIDFISSFNFIAKIANFFNELIFFLQLCHTLFELLFWSLESISFTKMEKL